MRVGGRRQRRTTLLFGLYCTVWSVCACLLLANALVGDGVPQAQPAPRSANLDSAYPSVACISLRLKPGEQLLCCSHALHR